MSADNFNRVDAGSLGSNWTEMISGFQIVSNQASGLNLATAQFAFYNAVKPCIDQYSQFIAPDSNGIGPLVRGNGSGASAVGYFAFQRPLASGNTLLFRLDNGSPVQIADLGAVDWRGGDVTKLTVRGTTLALYRNGAFLGMVTDATYTSGFPGIFVNSTFSLEDWVGGGLATVRREHRPAPFRPGIAR